MTNFEQTLERMRAEGYVIVESGESYTFDVEGRPFTVEGPCTVSPTGIVCFERGSTNYILDPKKFTVVGGAI